MRIAYFLADPGIGLFGTKGASVHAQEMIRAFRALGHEVTVWCTKRGDRAGDPSSEHVPADLADLPVYVVPTSGAKGAAEREAAVARAADRMATMAAAEGFDLVYERYSLFSAAGARTLRRSGGRLPRLVVEVNAPLLAEQAQHRTLHDAVGARDATEELFAAADVLSCVSEQVAGWARAATAGLGQPPQVVVTPNGVDPDRFRPCTLPAPPRPFTVGFLGTLKPWHGVDTLVRAFAAAPTEVRSAWQLELVGDGPEREPLAELARNLGVADQVIFRGPVSPEEVPHALRRFDVAAAPYPASETHYFSPLKVYEYMATGLPVVASAVGDLPDLLAGRRASHGDAGMLVTPGDAEELSRALAELAADAELRAHLGGAAREAVLAQHTWVQRAEQLLQRVDLPSPVPAEDAHSLTGSSA